MGFLFIAYTATIHAYNYGIFSSYEAFEPSSMVGPSPVPHVENLAKNYQERSLFAPSPSIDRNDSVQWMHAADETNDNRILQAYDAQTFKDLGHFSENYPYSTLKLPEIGKLLDIIRQHNISSCVNVALLHRHFDLTTSEILVERQFLDFSKISVYDINSDIGSQATAWPYMFGLHKSNVSERVQMFPLEFVYFDETDTDKKIKFEDQLQYLLQHPEFIQDYSRELDFLGLSEIFGLALKHRAHLDGNYGTVENSDEVNRILRVTPEVTKNAHSIDGQYNTNKTPKPMCTHFCAHCNRHFNETKAVKLSCPEPQNVQAQVGWSADADWQDKTPKPRSRGSLCASHYCTHKCVHCNKHK